MTIGVLFVCTGNICRSPTAEGVFRGIARDAGLEAAFSIDSAGTYGGHAGEPPSRLAIEAAARRGYDISGLRARPVTGKGSKAEIITDVRNRLWPLVEAGQVVPIIGRTLPLSNAAEAHRALEASDVFGKVVLTA